MILSSFILAKNNMGGWPVSQEGGASQHRVVNAQSPLQALQSMEAKKLGPDIQGLSAAAQEQLNQMKLHKREVPPAMYVMMEKRIQQRPNLRHLLSQENDNLAQQQAQQALQQAEGGGGGGGQELHQANERSPTVMVQSPQPGPGKLTFYFKFRIFGIFLIFVTFSAILWQLFELEHSEVVQSESITQGFEK